MMGRRPDSTLGKRKTVIGMYTADMVNKQIDIFKLVSVRNPVLEPRFVRWAMSKIDIMPADDVRIPGERTLKM